MANGHFAQIRKEKDRSQRPKYLRASRANPFKNRSQNDLLQRILMCMGGTGYSSGIIEILSFHSFSQKNKRRSGLFLQTHPLFSRVYAKPLLPQKESIHAKRHNTVKGIANAKQQSNSCKGRIPDSS